jgi:hypothetical protein
VTAKPAKVRFRKRLVEHPVGPITRCLDHGYFLTRGLAKVRADMRRTVLAYHLQRGITILGGKHLIAAVRSRASGPRGAGQRGPEASGRSDSAPVQPDHPSPGAGEQTPCTRAVRPIEQP